ncbi:1634_t:CDS:2, partial [Cetraspora pellucida]
QLYSEPPQLGPSHSEPLHLGPSHSGPSYSKTETLKKKIKSAFSVTPCAEEAFVSETSFVEVSCAEEAFSSLALWLLV